MGEKLSAKFTQLRPPSLTMIAKPKNRFKSVARPGRVALTVHDPGKQKL